MVGCHPSLGLTHFQTSWICTKGFQFRVLDMETWSEYRRCTSPASHMLVWGLPGCSAAVGVGLPVTSGLADAMYRVPEAKHCLITGRKLKCCGIAAMMLPKRPPGYWCSCLQLRSRPFPAQCFDKELAASFSNHMHMTANAPVSQRLPTTEQSPVTNHKVKEKVSGPLSGASRLRPFHTQFLWR